MQDRLIQKTFNPRRNASANITITSHKHCYQSAVISELGLIIGKQSCAQCNSQRTDAVISKSGRDWLLWSVNFLAAARCKFQCHLKTRLDKLRLRYSIVILKRVFTLFYFRANKIAMCVATNPLGKNCISTTTQPQIIKQITFFSHFDTPISIEWISMCRHASAGETTKQCTALIR